MANSHKSTPKHKFKEIIVFSKAYIAVSAIATIALVLLTYKDVLYLRFGTSFMIESSATYSSSTRQLLTDGFNDNLSRTFVGVLPLAALILVLIVVIYFSVSAYKRTYADLHVSKHYVNAKRVPTTNIAIRYALLCSAAFTVPLLYWCLYLSVWFPALVKYPIKYITNPSPLPLIMSSVAIITLLIAMTHVGLTLCRVVVRLFKYT